MLEGLCVYVLSVPLVYTLEVNVCGSFRPLGRSTPSGLQTLWNRLVKRPSAIRRLEALGEETGTCRVDTWAALCVCVCVIILSGDIRKSQQGCHGSQSYDITLEFDLVINITINQTGCMVSVYIKPEVWYQ